MRDRSTPPIGLFVYNRPDHTRRTVRSLAACKGAAQSDLFVFSDAAKNPSAADGVAEVREFIATVDGFRSVEIIEREKNLGSAGSISDGITHLLTEHERAIFIEDDLICAPYALKFLTECLDRYEDQPNVMAATAYNYPPGLMRIPKGYEYDVYFSPGFFPWGWASWRRALDVIDWDVPDYEEFITSPSRIEAFRQIGEDLPGLLARQQAGELDDWVLPLTYSQFNNNFVTVRPVQSLIDNVGHDGSGLHCHDTEIFRNDLSLARSRYRFPHGIFIDERLLRACRLAHSRSFMHRAARRILDQALKARRWVGA